MNAMPMVARCMEYQAWSSKSLARGVEANAAARAALLRAGGYEYTVSIWSVAGISTSLMSIKEG